MDFYFSEVQGGAEINAESLIDRMTSKGIQVNKMKSADVTVDFLSSNKDCVFIFNE